MKIFIGCSSSNDIPSIYLTESEKFLTKIFENNNDLVFGANNKGIMGLSYNIAQHYNREVIGICPKAYVKDFELLECAQEITTRTIEERTTKLIEYSDAIVFLPGGIGTIYELMAVIESKRSGEFDKPVVIYNINNFFGEFLSCLEKIYTEKFTVRKVENCYYITTNIDDALMYINNYK